MFLICILLLYEILLVSESVWKKIFVWGVLRLILLTHGTGEVMRKNITTPVVYSGAVILRQLSRYDLLVRFVLLMEMDERFRRNWFVHMRGDSGDRPQIEMVPICHRMPIGGSVPHVVRRRKLKD